MGHPIHNESNMGNNHAGKVTLIAKQQLPQGSKQVEDQTVKGIVSPPISFYSLQKAYDNSFVLGGVFEKLASAGDSGFKETGKQELDAILHGVETKRILESLLVFGNTFVEKVMDGRGKVAELSFILTDTMSVWNMNDQHGYIQQVSGRRAFFLPEEIMHLKLASVSSNWYGESKFAKTVDQIVLLSKIDQYYDKMFDKNFMGSNLFTDEGDSQGKKLNEANRDKLESWLEDNAMGLDNAFAAAIVPTKLTRVKLEESIDPEAFLTYRTELIKSIAIGLNMPVDLLLSDNANRSTSEVAYETLNQIIVQPLQEILVAELKAALRDTFGNDVDLIVLNPIGTEDNEKEMKVLTGYKKSGVLTANEVREKLGYPKHVDGDALVVDSGGAQTPAEVAKEVEEITKSLSAMYDGTAL